ncbi:MAG: hypothetical protein WBB28_19600 [Crinalium sp.]
MSDRLRLCPDDWKECDRTLKSEDAKVIESIAVLRIKLVRQT